MSKRGRLVTTSTQFSVSAKSGSVAQGGVKVREGRLHVSLFRATDSSVVAIVESVTVAPSQRGSIGKQVQEMQRAGFRVDKVPLMFQVAYFRAAKGGPRL